MSAAGAVSAPRVGRYYTAARRHPWVLGKVADWKIPLGPYTPAQLAVAVGGGFVLFKTVHWWSWLGPLPVVTWLLAVWAVRRQKFRGRAPLPAALGLVLLGCQPHGGRIGGRAARDRRPRTLTAGFTIEGARGPRPASHRAPSRTARRRTTAASRPAPGPARAARSSTRPPRHTAGGGPVVGPASSVQQLLLATDATVGGA
ncbi:hypothetical protein SAMN06272735_9170 [Streptomyces sp. TLI_55]|uniref:hypothetical protein n=1 Tax=Streptomyces sp. TLI_55 TaxID=1938861 RepID=UPI000BD59DF5|nr:hypothetical protein [Streptomyces sp. TLI_55]SNX88679.1 hypothetical protein SAMN06272735_9170 [Streptomyces sp. TLI_55]